MPATGTGRTPHAECGRGGDTAQAGLTGHAHAGRARRRDVHRVLGHPRHLRRRLPLRRRHVPCRLRGATTAAPRVAGGSPAGRTYPSSAGPGIRGRHLLRRRPDLLPSRHRLPRRGPGDRDGQPPGHLRRLHRVAPPRGAAGHPPRYPPPPRRAPILEATVATAIFSALGGLVVGDLGPFPGWQSVGWLVLLALSAQTAGGLLIAIALPRLPAVTTSLLLLSQPVASIFLAMIIVAETPSPLQLLGVGLVVVGVAVGTVPFGRGAAGMRRSSIMCT